jgi:ligand-binding sensor protein
LSQQIVTSDKNIFKRFGTQSRQKYKGKERCNICGEEIYYTNRGYIHNCKARLSSGKPIQRNRKIKSARDI